MDLMTLSLGLLDHCLSTFRGEQHLCPLIKGCQIVMISAQIPESVSSILTMKTFNENCFCMFFFVAYYNLRSYFLSVYSSGKIK